MVADPAPIAALVAGIFDELGVPHVLGGSMASTLHGEPRATLGADFAVDLHEDVAQALFDRLDRDFFLDALSVREAATQKRMFNAIYKQAFVKVDVHVRENSGHSAEEFRRAIETTLSGGGSVRVATPEDTVLRKLWWYRMGEEVSDRQWRDVLGVLRAVASELDHAYLAKWSVVLEVPDLLERALRESAST